MFFKFASIVIFFCLFFIYTQKIYAVTDPFASFNNKFGIHILFTEEIEEASKFVNSSGGDWGYVIIPIQSGDKDREKWQLFMNKAKKLHIIPIIRLATEGDYFNTKVWARPKETDIIDFANFLNSLDWPVKNKYIVVFNEVNRGDEWGGESNPGEYARLLAYSVNVFKSLDSDFFIISAGLDNAAPNNPPSYMNQFDFLTEMNKEVPGIFAQIDGLSSHSYPNPAFSMPPDWNGKTGIKSFDFERQHIKKMSGRQLPIFITETGWSGKSVSESVRADYYKQAFGNIWNDYGIVAVTPFLFNGTGVFQEFSFFTENGLPSLQYQALKTMPKVKGMPVLPKIFPDLLMPQKRVLGIDDDFVGIDKVEASVKDFGIGSDKRGKFSLENLTMSALKWLIGD